MNRLVQLCLILVLLSSCAKTADNEVSVYSNNFENGDLKGITNGSVSSFAGTKVLGGYSNKGFDLILNDLPSHDLIDVTFDLYIHDGWVGNQKLTDNENAPDIWQLKVNNKTFINTTFSNQDCITGNICPPQSYPADYPNNNYNPRSGASRTDLPGVCSQLDKPNGSTLYRIHKSISHSEKTLLLQCFDQIDQKNPIDKKCVSSWSIDNINIKVIKLH